MKTTKDNIGNLYWKNNIAYNNTIQSMSPHKGTVGKKKKFGQVDRIKNKYTIICVTDHNIDQGT